MKVKKRFGNKIYIEWVDAIEKSGWKSIKDAVKPDDEVYCRTNSFYIGEDKIFIKTASTIGKTNKNDVTSIMWIPKRQIIRIK